MKIKGNTVKVGNIIEFENSLWSVVKTDHVKPGKGGAFAQVELKEVRHGTKKHHRFRSDEDVERVILEEKEYNFLYQDDDTMHFMDNTNFEQIDINVSMLGEKSVLLSENMTVKIAMHDNDVINVHLPDQVVVTVAEADAVTKNQTATSSYKPAKLDNGLEVLVPPYITAGTKIKIRTEDLSYVSREQS